MSPLEPLDKSTPKRVEGPVRRSVSAACRVASRLSRPAGYRVDAICLLLLLGWGFYWGAMHMNSAAKPLFYQKHFAPAVMRAVGQGFVNPAKYSEVDGLSEFLAVQRMDLPELERSVAIETRPLDYFQPAHRYMLEAAAMCWFLLGVAWSNLWPLYGALFGLLAVGAYLLCRTCCSAALSLPASVIFCLSAPVMTMLPHLRDFSKAPFLLTDVALLLWAVLFRGGVRGAAVLAAIAGITVGIGLGFRTDLLALVPFGVLLLAAFGHRRQLRGYMARLLCCSAFVAAFAAASWPVLSVYRGERGGNNVWHVINLGLMSKFDASLGVAAATTHELGHMYLDGYMGAIVNDFAKRNIDPSHKAVPLSTVRSDQLNAQYYREVARTFPADLATRSLAAMIRGIGCWPVPTMPSIGICLVAAALLILMGARMQWGGLFALIVAYFGATMSLQFDPRHYFYLAIAPVFAAGILLQTGASVARHRLALGHGGWPDLAMFRGNLPDRMLRRGFVKRLMCLSGMVLLSIAVFQVLRMYQVRQVEQLVGRYVAAPKVGCAFERQYQSETDTVLLTPTARALSQQSREGSRLWLLELMAPPVDEPPLTGSSIRVRLTCGGDTPSRPNHSRELLFAHPDSPQPSGTILRYAFFTMNVACEFPVLEIDADYDCLVSSFCELDAGGVGPLVVNAQLPVEGGRVIPYQTLGHRPPDALVAPRAIATNRAQLDLTSWARDKLVVEDELNETAPLHGHRVLRIATSPSVGRRVLIAPSTTVRRGLHRFTVVAKAGPGDAFRVQLAGKGGGFFANFDLREGSVLRSGKDTRNATIETVGGGWYRLSVDFAHRGGTTKLAIRRLAVIDDGGADQIPSSTCIGSLLVAVPEQFPAGDCATTAVLPSEQ